MGRGNLLLLSSCLLVESFVLPPTARPWAETTTTTTTTTGGRRRPALGQQPLPGLKVQRRRTWLFAGGYSSSSSKNGTSLLEKENRYYEVVSGLTPSQMIGRFVSTAPRNVQDAVKQTILGLLGPTGMDAAKNTPSERLANLMFQLQMTGYMFRNAEYRVTLERSLSPSKLVPEVRGGSIAVEHADGRVSVENAASYVDDLRKEVNGLRQEMAEENALLGQRDLLAYVRQLPEATLGELTADVTEDVLDAMKKLVYSILRGLPDVQRYGIHAAQEVWKIRNEPKARADAAAAWTTERASNDNDLDDDPTKTDLLETAVDAAPTTVEQSGKDMFRLCIWQLVIGYNLRELEVRGHLEDQVTLAAAGAAGGAGGGGGGGAAPAQQSSNPSLIN